MRSLLQFLGLSAKPNPDAGTFELGLADEFWFDKTLGRMLSACKARSCPEVTYEIRADNLGGGSFDAELLACYKKRDSKKAELVARFLYGAHVHTAHLTWGANHSDGGPIWDINDPNANKEVVREICDLLEELVYKGKREVPWDADYQYRDDPEVDPRSRAG